MPTQTYLKVNQLDKAYENDLIIDQVSFEIRLGERLALFAPSGAGKSTMIKILSGLEPPSSGGYAYSGPQPVVIFQESRLFPFLTVAENILLPHKVRPNRMPAELSIEYHRWLEVCELEKVVEQFPYQLSGGMKRKVSLIRGLLGKPGFVFMDEPFQSIHPAGCQAMIEHIKQTLPELTLLFVTHSVEEVAHLATTALVFTSNHLTAPVRMDPQSFAAAAYQNLNTSAERIEIFD
jgi:NitT/TauT family transport system ATP-binding protein